MYKVGNGYFPTALLGSRTTIATPTVELTFLGSTFL
jgi:hypothetical protein